MDVLTIPFCNFEEPTCKTRIEPQTKPSPSCIVCSQKITDSNTAPPHPDVGGELNYKNLIDLLFQLLDISYSSIESVLLAPLFANGLPLSEAKFCYDCDLWISYGIDLKKKLRTVKEKIISNALQSRSKASRHAYSNVEADGCKLQACVSRMVKQCFSRCKIDLTRDDTLVPPIKTRKRKPKRIKTEPADAEFEEALPDAQMELRSPNKSASDEDESADMAARCTKSVGSALDYVQEIVEVSLNDDDPLWEPPNSYRGYNSTAAENTVAHDDVCMNSKPKSKKKASRIKMKSPNSRKESSVPPVPLEHTCQHCDQKFPCFAVLQVHINEEHNPIADDPLIFTCSICSLNFNQQAYKVIDSEAATFSYSSDVDGEKRMYSTFTEFCKCHFDICSAGVSTPKDSDGKSGRRKRKRKYTKPDFGIFKCEICGKEMTSPRYYNDHMNYHLKTNESQCPICLQSFPMERALSQHINRVHHLERMFNDHYSCKYCQKPFMGRHPESESGEFIQDDSELLVAFAELHASCGTKVNSTKSMPVLPCKFCQEPFSTYKHLIAHEIRLHTKNFRYCCEKCGSSYVTAVDLYQHQKAHIPTRNHQCELCPANYKRASHLKDHMRLHTGEAPYVCKVCGKCFHNSTRLRSHEDTHNQERTEPCKYCGKLYRTKANVYSHIFAVHKKLRKPRVNPRKLEKMEGMTQPQVWSL